MDEGDLVKLAWPERVVGKRPQESDEWIASEKIDLSAALDK